tara:strand:- start:366 stop:608 length:243 start_codon:yes stop_codon:yes gene_type:complete
VIGLSISISNDITGRSSGVSIGTELFEAYKLRVIADGGTVENDTCTIAFLDNLNAIKIPIYLLLGDTGFILQEDTGKIIL